jgi:transposase-like protein
VIALSPRSLMATNRFVCEVCGKGFQREQNLQLHRRGHNLPWKLKQKNPKDALRRRVYLCPEPTCVHHDPARALGDLTGIKKHYCRKHGEKKWKCDKCAKRYAVQSDWKAHSKTCGTREYRCDCGTLFSRYVRLCPSIDRSTSSILAKYISSIFSLFEITVHMLCTVCFSDLDMLAMRG